MILSTWSPTVKIGWLCNFDIIFSIQTSFCRLIWLKWVIFYRFILIWVIWWSVTFSRVQKSSRCFWCVRWLVVIPLFPCLCVRRLIAISWTHTFTFFIISRMVISSRRRNLIVWSFFITCSPTFVTRFLIRSLGHLKYRFFIWRLVEVLGCIKVQTSFVLSAAVGLLVSCDLFAQEVRVKLGLIVGIWVVDEPSVALCLVLGCCLLANRCSFLQIVEMWIGSSWTCSFICFIWYTFTRFPLEKLRGVKNTSGFLVVRRSDLAFIMRIIKFLNRWQRRENLTLFLS